MESGAGFDAIVIGAGVSGLYQLHRLRRMGLRTLVIEAGSGVGGTWFWNRYPGARFDSESLTYGYSFSPELVEEWSWSERFAAQPETLRYLEHVAARFDLTPDIRLDTVVTGARWDGDARRWLVETADGFRADCRFLVTAIGILSAPTLPSIDGIDSFAGEAHHTARWPEGGLDVAGCRVGVIGTGATGVQCITELARTAGALTVFQRRPNWCVPLGNAPLDPAENDEFRRRWEEVIAACNDTFGGFLHDPGTRSRLGTTEDERRALYEELYHAPGFALWLGNYAETLVDPVANAEVTAFVADKIRQRVDDPAVAEMLIPTDHGFGTRRVPLESGYYEVYNQPNVTLVDLTATPIERIEPKGVRTTSALHELDVLVYATGFDAITGAFDRIDITGSGGKRLRDVWGEVPSTYLGVQVHGFPNLFMVAGPQSSSTLCNMPRCIEHSVDFVTACIAHTIETGASSIEPTEAAQRRWAQHVAEVAEPVLLSHVDSWFTGSNSNVDHGPRSVAYFGGLPLYRETCETVAANGFQGFTLS